MKKYLLPTVMILIAMIALSACATAAPTPTPATSATTGSSSPTLAALTPLATTAAHPTPTPRGPATSFPTPVKTATLYSITDPFKYCAIMGTINAPDANYTGTRMPANVVKGLIKASGASADVPVEIFASGSFWRCANGQVLACYVGANLPCTDKANPSTDPTEAETSYCTANPASDFIPAAVTGHDTVYEWSCKDGKATPGKQVFKVDAQGFIAEIWYVIEQP
jgi:hypothetical protein